MAQIIAIEGIDRVGKTTLAKKIQSKLGIKTFKDVSYFGFTNDINVNVEKVITFIEMVKQLDLTVVCDRFFLTEVVYSTIERNNGRASEYFQIIHDYIKNSINDDNLKFLLIYVKPSNIELSGKLHGSTQIAHNNMYKRLYNNIRFDKKSCQWENLDKMVFEVKAWSVKNG